MKTPDVQISKSPLIAYFTGLFYAFLSSDGGALSFTYDYTPAVPEPRLLILTLLGGASPLVRYRRKMSRQK
jgi:hypothetical protein